MINWRWMSGNPTLGSDANSPYKQGCSNDLMQSELTNVRRLVFIILHWSQFLTYPLNNFGKKKKNNRISVEDNNIAVESTKLKNILIKLNQLYDLEWTSVWVCIRWLISPGMYLEAVKYDCSFSCWCNLQNYSPNKIFFFFL